MYLGIFILPKIVDDLQVAMSTTQNSHHRLMALNYVGHDF